MSKFNLFKSSNKNELRKVGRPKLAPEDRRVYQRIAISPIAYKQLKRLAKQKNMNMIDYIDKVAEKLSTK